MGVYGLLGHEITRLSVGLFLCNVALSIVIVALEYLISYLFGEGKNNWQYLGNIVRIAPGMGMFFLFMFILRKADEEAYAMDRLVFLTEKTYVRRPGCAGGRSPDHGACRFYLRKGD